MFRIGAVIVLYRLSIDRSATFSSFLRGYQECRHEVDCQIYVVDNSPDGNGPGPFPAEITYIPVAENLGIANAYNRAIELAREEDRTWLFTLDQDTTLPTDYVSKMIALAKTMGSDSEVAAIVPHIIANGRRVSPYYFQFGAVPRYYRSEFFGVATHETFAFNSAALLRVSALEQVGGYDPRFWLDCSDTMMFHRLHKHGIRVHIAGGIKVNHDFSMKRQDETLSRTRYHFMLLSESAAWDLEMNWLARLERTARLSVRLIRYLVKQENKHLWRLSCLHLYRRVIRSKSKRLEEWRRETETRLGGHLASSRLHIPDEKRSESRGDNEKGTQ